MPTVYFQNCRCPHCKTKLDALPESAPACPTCNQPLDPAQVWSTRSYPGILDLPPWLGAFTWPLLLMILGMVLFFILNHPFHRFASIIFGLGLLFFLLKLFGADDYPSPFRSPNPPLARASRQASPTKPNTPATFRPPKALPSHILT